MTEPTDLRERLREVEGSLSWCEHRHQRAASTPAQWANHVKVLRGDINTVREAAAALERLEALGDALERICRNDIGASFDQRYVEERVRDFASWERGFSDALSIVQRIARRALTTPAPATQQGGTDD